MAQEFCILRCYSCEKFQVHIVKKAKKWDCKMCGAKQSFIKVFGQGDARHCREHVQKLNMEEGLKSERAGTYQDSHQEKDIDFDNAKWGSVDGQYHKTPGDPYPDGNHITDPHRVSKWACFLEPEDT